MQKKIIFFNIGWMERYQGLKNANDRITGGGSYVAKKGFGWEIFNYKPFQGYLYGYVEGPKFKSRININRLGASQDSIDHVLVIWTAKKPSGGVYIVGWYDNAIVYKHYHDAPQNSKREYADNDLGFYAMAKKRDGRLLLVKIRKFRIPVGKNGKGWCNIWYADSPVNDNFRRQVFRYVEQLKKDPNNFVKL